MPGISHPAPLSLRNIVCVGVCAIVSLAGCRASNQSPQLISFAPTTTTQTKSPDNSNNVRQVNFQAEGEVDSNVSLISTDVESVEFPSAGAGQIHEPVRLGELEQLLISTHPEILKAQSQVAALEGQKRQAGLGPNPTAGIIGDDLNANDGAGRFGVFYGQQVVRGGKLELAQSVVDSQIAVALNTYQATKQRLLIELRQRYYNVLLAQETLQQTLELSAVLERSVKTSEQLFEAQEIAKAPVLRSQVELQNVNMMVRQAENQRTKALRRIAALLGESTVRFESLAGDVRDAPTLGDFESAFDQMLENHPELSVALSNIEQAHRKLAQQQAAPIPNLTWQTSVQYDFTTDELVGGFQVGMPIPRFNRNEGAISQAWQNIQSSVHAADQKVLELRDRLTESWGNYVDATIQIETLDHEIIPKAAEALELASEGYRQGETPYLELLLAQQLFAKTKLGYLQTLKQRWEFEVEIRGLIEHYVSASSCP